MELAEFQSPEKDFGDTARLTKRRKFYRKRTEDEDHESSTSAAQTYASPLTLDELVISQDIIPTNPARGDNSSLSVTGILRQRKAAQRKRGGIEFSNATTTSITALAAPRPSSALITSKNDALTDIEAVVNRFTPQTGQVVDVDNKHMYAFPLAHLQKCGDAATNVSRMAYIDAELAKRRQGQDNLDSFAGGYGGQGLGDLGVTDLGVQRQPAALGKLHEIDLGPDVTLRNIARTEAAKRRLEDGEEDVEEGNGEVRLRKDGKPWRGRRRRNSEDVKRDKLVEEVLRESRCMFVLWLYW